MKRRVALLWLAACLALTGVARADPPARRMALLTRGINLTNWFRYPPSGDADVIRTYMTAAALRSLRRAGFHFVRLPVQPEFLAGDPGRKALLLAAIARLHAAGLAVIVCAQPSTWDLERPEDAERLLAFWRGLAPALRGADADRTFVEVVNEPVFERDPEGWAALQHAAIGVIRAALPTATVVLTGNRWGGVDGLLRLRPEADPDVIYSVHFYEPMEFTTFASAPNWARTDPKARIAAVADWGRRNHAAVLAGEFGATARQPAPTRLAWVRLVRQNLERQRIGWALWGLEDVHGFDLPRPPPLVLALDPDLLKALGLHEQPGGGGSTDGRKSPVRLPSRSRSGSRTP